MGTILHSKFVFFVADRGYVVASVDWSVLSAEAVGLFCRMDGPFAFFAV